MIAWAIKHADYGREYLEGGARIERPREFAGYVTMAFRTRREARAYIEKQYGYIRNRPDLQASPHCWRMPKAVRISVTVTELPR